MTTMARLLVAATLLALPAVAHASCPTCSPAYSFGLNIGLGGDWYGPKPVLPAPPPRAPTRVYLFRGLGHLSNFGPLAADLRATGATVLIYGWRQQDRVLRDALRHPTDRIVVGGHSMGDWAAFQVAPRIVAAGVPVRVIGLDPLCTFPQSSVGGVNIWGSYCGRYPGTVPGAENIYIADTSHIHYPVDASVRAAFMRAVYWN
jgi:hypothetical protein